MLDAIRIASTLAICAVHLVDGGYWTAIAGVLALYALSGHLFPSGDPWRVMAGRYWRIWPAYALVFLLSALAFAVGFYSPVYFAGNPDGPTWLAQFALVVQPGGLRVLPVGWMLSAQLAAWLLLAVCGGNRRAIALLAGGALVLVIAQGYYQSLAVATLFTAAGAMVPRFKGRRIPGAALCYPVLLTHYPVAAVVDSVLGVDKGWGLLLLSAVPTVAAALALQRFDSLLRR